MIVIKLFHEWTARSKRVEKENRKKHSFLVLREEKLNTQRSVSTGSPTCVYVWSCVCVSAAMSDCGCGTLFIDPIFSFRGLPNLLHARLELQPTIKRRHFLIFDIRRERNSYQNSFSNATLDAILWDVNIKRFNQTTQRPQTFNGISSLEVRSPLHFYMHRMNVVKHENKKKYEVYELLLMWRMGDKQM